MKAVAEQSGARDKAESALAAAVAMAIEAIERGSSTAPVLECLKAALEQHGARDKPSYLTTDDEEKERPPLRHSWSEPERPDEHHTICICRKCSVRRVGRHESGEHWFEFFTPSGRRIECEGTPICPGRES